MSIDHIIEQDLRQRFFYLKPKYFFDFFFFFFFRCLYAIVFDIIYILLFKKELHVNRSFEDITDVAKYDNVLFVGDSTMSFPFQEWSFPYLFKNDGLAKNVDIISRFGLSTYDLLAYVRPKMTDKNKKYDIICISCFQCEIIARSIFVEGFEKATIELLEYFKSKLTSDWKIVYVYGDFSTHPIVPDNYFKRYFHYKTDRLLSILQQFISSDFQLLKLMDFHPQESRKQKYQYIHVDWLHFSRVWQQRLYKDFVLWLSI